MKLSRAVIATCVALVLLLAALPGAAQAAPVTERVSITSDEAQATGNSTDPSVSTDGRFIVFASLASDLVAGDTNNSWDIFLRDRTVGVTVRVSVSDSEAQANGHCNYPSVSADGRFVAFYGLASNLVPGDTNGQKDVFVRDLVLQTTVRVSRSTGGSQGNGGSAMPSISACGRYVAFESAATNLVSGDTNGEEDVFVRDLTAARTTRVSVSTAGAQGSDRAGSASISADGRYVAFVSEATNLVSGDTNGSGDVFVRDRTAGTTERVSVSSSEAQANNSSDGAAISADGRYVAFRSAATDLIVGDTNAVADIFVRDRIAGTTDRVSLNTDDNQANGVSAWPVISANGRYVAFESAATNLTADSNLRTDIFLRDRQTGSTFRMSVSTSQGQGNNDSTSCAISADGMVVGFQSGATSLVTGDTNGVTDVFARVTTGGIAYSSIRGSDRYDTAIRISKAMIPQWLEVDQGLVLAPGETFQEALCGAPLAARYGGPVLLTPSSGLRADVLAEMQRLGPEYVFCIGLSGAIVQAVDDALPFTNVVSIVGTDVYDMSRKVANKLDQIQDLSGATAIVTIGTNFPDALGVSPLACGKYWPIILTDKSDGSALHASAAAALSELGITKMLKVGTYAALPAGVAGVGNCSGADRYITNRNVVEWTLNNTALTCAHIGVTTGEKFPDALAAGPYLQYYDGDPTDGLLFLTPLAGPLPPVVADEIYANRAAVQKVALVACIEPVVSLVKALLP